MYVHVTQHIMCLFSSPLLRLSCIFPLSVILTQPCPHFTLSLTSHFKLSFHLLSHSLHTRSSLFTHSLSPFNQLFFIGTVWYWYLSNTCIFANVHYSFGTTLCHQTEGFESDSWLVWLHYLTTFQSISAFREESASNLQRTS